MAKINEITSEVEFDLNELDAAWNNSFILVNKDKNQFRMCFICKFHMERKYIDAIDHTGSGWTIDLINAKNPRLENDNYIAVHQNCVPNRPKLDCTKIIKKMRKLQFMFNEEYWKDN